MAAADLAAGAEVAARCAANHGQMHAVWKLLGDIQLQHHSVTPEASRSAAPGDRSALAAAVAERHRPWLCHPAYDRGGCSAARRMLWEPESGRSRCWHDRLCCV